MLIDVRGQRRVVIVGREGGEPAFSPDSIANLSVWHDPSDLVTMRQERTGASATTPTAVDEPVGSMLNKGSLGGWWTAPSDAGRPTLRSDGTLYWLEGDGSDDSLSGTFTEIAQPFTQLSAWMPIVTPAAGQTALLVAANRALFIDSPTLRVFYGNGGASTYEPVQDEDFIAIERINGASSQLGVDADAYADVNAGTNGITDHAIFSGIGSNFNGRFYGRLLYNRALTDAEIALCVTYLAAKQGRVL